MAALNALFGETLVGKGGDVKTTDALAGKTVGIYFSAHWCPPCRGFTPKLAEYYTNDLKAKGFEVVFVSSDKDDGAFKEYFADMPWLALPYSDRAKKDALSKKFKVQGIPSFVILDGEGNTITTDGRSKVMADPKGENFPWKPMPFSEAIGSTFLKGKETVGKEALAGKTIGIYFSAHWCPPCRGFTPKLCEAYKNYKAKGLPFEIVFSTGDRDEESFKSYYEEMCQAGGDWLAIPYENNKAREALDGLFEVSGIPTLVICDSEGNVINKNARGAMMADMTGDAFPWAPPPVKDLADPEGIDENVALVVFAEALPANQQEKVMKTLEPFATKYIDEGKAAQDDPKYIFFMAKNNEGPVGRVRELCKLGAAPSMNQATVATKGEQSPVGMVRTISNDLGAPHAQMVLLNIPDNGGYYVSDAVEITEEVVKGFLADYEANKLERKQLG